MAEKWQTRLYKTGMTMDGSEISIEGAKLEKDFQNKLIAVPKPVSPANQATTVPTMILKDLKRFDQVMTLTGFIITGSSLPAAYTNKYITSINREDALVGTSDQSSNPCFISSAPAQGILFTGGDLKLDHKGRTYTVQVDKVKIVDDANTHQDWENNVNIQDVIITFKIGSQV